MQEHVWEPIDEVYDPALMCVACLACKCCTPDAANAECPGDYDPDADA